MWMCAQCFCFEVHMVTYCLQRVKQQALVHNNITIHIENRDENRRFWHSESVLVSREEEYNCFVCPTPAQIDTQGSHRILNK